MATHSVAAGEVGAHEKTLVADTVDTVTFADDLPEIQVHTDGTATIYVTVDNTAPAVAASRCWRVPNVVGASTTIRVRTTGATVVKLISAGTPMYSVSRTS